MNDRTTRLISQKSEFILFRITQLGTTMTRRLTCKAHMKTLGLDPDALSLGFPYPEDDVQRAFDDLVDTHHPDFCEEDDVCRETNKPLIERIAEAHLYLREHGEECHLIERATLLEKAIQCYKTHMGDDMSGESVEVLGVVIDFCKDYCPGDCSELEA